MKESHKTLLTIILPIVVVVGGLIYLSKQSQPNAGGQLDEFAQCLTDKGAKLYTAWWCPHCNDQKEMFGSAIEYVDNIECAEPGDRGEQTQECADAGITGYPTWVFASGEHRSGVMSLSDLADKTGCELPAEEE